MTVTLRWSAICYRHSYRQLPSCAKLKISHLTEYCVSVFTMAMKVLTLLRKQIGGMRELQCCSGNVVPGMGIALQLLLNRKSQALHAPAHVRVASRDPDPDAARDRDHRRAKMASTRASAATSTPASTMTRRSFPISISMRPLAGAARADGAGSATTIARTKPDLCPSAPSGSVQNDRRQFSNSEREMPYRRAVDEIARGVSMLSATILSFSSSAQRRRRPVSTTPRRST